MWFSVNNIFKKFHSIIVLKWREASEHFMDEAAKTPPVNFNTMSFLSYNFWSQILGSTTNCLGFLLVILQNFWKSEVSELNITWFIDDYILWLKAE